MSHEARDMSGAVNLAQWKTNLKPEELYAGLDEGIRFAVRVLHADGIDTCQSCQGGAGHSYDRPTIEMRGGDALGFAALNALVEYGIRVHEVARVWTIDRGHPVECLWRVELHRDIADRADERPSRVQGYQFVTSDVPAIDPARATRAKRKR